jgi:hypothetical protein
MVTPSYTDFNRVFSYSCLTEKSSKQQYMDWALDYVGVDDLKVLRLMRLAKKCEE